MANKKSHGKRRHSKSRTMRRTRSQKGGDLAGNPASAWGWGMGTVGNGWQQFMNSLTLQPGDNLGTIQSNATVPIGNLNAQDSQGLIGVNLNGDIPQGGGRKRSSHKRSHKRSHSRKGGCIGAAVNQAAVPFVLLAANTLVKPRKQKK
jgi:hypothetical protein